MFRIPSHWAVWSAVALLSLVSGALAWVLGGAAGLLYVPLFMLATLPGWPVGWALFGCRHGAGWIAGALIGYVLSSFVIWLAVRLGQDSFAGFFIGWALLCAATGCLYLVREPFIRLPHWSRRETTALLLVLVVVPALLAPPFRNIGAQNAEGLRHYRAYFTADFLWHMALTDELTTFDLPPANPYAADLTLNYYWTYFLIPAAILDGPLSGRLAVEDVLMLNALCAGLLFVAMIMLSAWRVAGRAVPAAIAVLIAILAASAEGGYALWDLWSRGQSLTNVRMLNIDAITLWFLQGLTIDGLVRSLWYTPQHAMACALGLIALLGACSETTSAKSAALVGVALAGGVAVSPFLGGSFALIYGLVVATDAISRKTPFLPSILPHAVAAALTALAVVWCVGNEMLEGARGALQLGFQGNARNAPVWTLLLALGPLLIPGLFGLWVGRRLPPAAIPAVMALLVGLGLFYLVSIGSTDPVWVGWRAGQILLVTLPGLAALWLATAWDSRRGRWPAVALVTGLFAIGVPTTAIDLYNAQDISNRELGPGFPWTVVVTPDQQAAFDWIKRYTPSEAVVQMEPTVRGRATWTLIPTFAQRRMAAGLPISLVMTEEYQRRAQRVQELYGTTDAERAWTIAQAMQIDYLYVDQTERQAYGEGIRKFDTNPQYFRPMYQRGDVAVYAVGD